LIFVKSILIIFPKISRPFVGDINSRLKNLYHFDKALSKAQGRMANLNLLGLGGKLILTGGTGPLGKSLAVLSEIAGKGGIKSGLAIGLNDLAKGGGKEIEKGKGGTSFSFNSKLNPVPGR